MVDINTLIQISNFYCFAIGCPLLVEKLEFDQKLGFVRLVGNELELGLWCSIVLDISKRRLVLIPWLVKFELHLYFVHTVWHVGIEVIDSIIDTAWSFLADIQ